MSVFAKYETEVLLKVHGNLERGVVRATEGWQRTGSHYDANSYHLSLDFLAQVEDELYARGVDPHDKS